MSNLPSFTLNDSTTLPAIGFGTYKLNGSSGVDALQSAIKLGYRCIDTAVNYENEGAVGQAVRNAGIAREELRITSKLPGRHQRYAQAITTIEESLYRAGLDYYDLYLIHWPNPSQNLYVEAWSALIEAQKKGLVRSIGVCNFLPDHLDRLFKETGVMPSVNQIELHPLFSQAEQRQANRARGILTQAWSPLARTEAIIQNEVLAQIAKIHGCSIPQVVLRWHVQLGNMPLPKATSPQRQKKNLSLDSLELTSQDMEAIAKLTKTDGRMKNQDPAHHEEF